MPIAEDLNELALTIARTKKKYLEERDKRLRPEGLEQYRSVDVTHGEYARDPFSPEAEARAPLIKEVNIVIIGGGHAGLLVADSLIKNGLDDFLIIEKAADFGGTWYWNRYPDCRCDIESYIYMPLLEDGGEMPAEKYVRSSVIRANASRIGRRLGLYDKALFHTGVISATWAEADQRWHIKTDRGDEIRTRFVSLGSGPMSRPKLPGIPGIEKFEGKMFHTSRWDYSYTGGDESGGLTGLFDKNVAVIGTGATGCQVIPAVAQAAQRLYVVQRTPAAVIERFNRVTDHNWWNSLPSAWWKERASNFSAFTVGQSPSIDYISDRWTEIFTKFNVASQTETEAAKAAGISAEEIVDFRIMSGLRQHIEERVKDKKTAESLKPWYNLFCKRPLFLQGYYDTFNRDNVTLIDTDGKGLDAITHNSIVFNNQEYPVDCIIFASGFEVAVPLDRAGGLELRGKSNLTLKERWQDGMISLHGMMVHNFPNMFFIGGVRHAAFSWNVTYNLKLQADHFAAIMRHVADAGAKTVEVREAAEQAWLEELEQKSAVDMQFLTDCTPGYINNEGADIDIGIASQGYGAGVLAYAEQLEQWRQNKIENDLELSF